MPIGNPQSMFQQDIVREAFFGFMGGSIAIAGLRSFQAAAQSAVWPRTSAKVVGARVVERPSRASAGDASRTIYAIEISYEFEAQGETHLKSHVEPERVSWSLASLAESQLRRYPNGALVDVCYNPKRPRESILVSQRPTRWGAITTTAVGAMIIIGVLIFHILATDA